MSNQYWIGVVSRSHVQIGVKGGFMQLNHGKRAPLAKLKAGDGVVFYSPRESYPDGAPLQAFTAMRQARKENTPPTEEEQSKVKSLLEEILSGLDKLQKANRKYEVTRFKGLGEMMAAQLKETTMDPRKRILLRVQLKADEKKQTDRTVDRLMGTKAEARFEFITERAEFAKEEMLDV